jgi:MprA protease rhombosortase-interaction domain-containing protein
MRLGAVIAAAVGVAIGLDGAARAQSVSQTVSLVDYNFSDFTGASNLQLSLFANGLSAPIDPFNASLGTLQSFTTSLTITEMFSGVAGTSGGSVSGGFEGSLAINGVAYDSKSTGGGNGGPPGSTISFSAGLSNYSDQFSGTDTPTTYDPSILAAVTGTDPFAFSYGDPGSDLLSIYFDGITSGLFTVTGSVTITYDYAPIPEPASAMLLAPMLGLLGFARRRRARG